MSQTGPATGVAGRVSGHSLRVGSAQSLAAAGAGLVELQEAGDWQAPHHAGARGAGAKRRYQAGRGSPPQSQAGRAYSASRAIRYSMVRLPLIRLQELQSSWRLSIWSVPPRLCGITWSTSNAR